MKLQWRSQSIRSITNLIYRMINHLQSKYPLKGYNQDKPSQALILGCFLMAVNKLQKSKIPMGAGHPTTVIAHNLRLRRMIEAKQRKTNLVTNSVTVGKSEQIEEPIEPITIQDARATSSPVIGNMSDYSSFEITKSYDIPVPVYVENEDLEEIINRWKVDER